MFWIILLIGSAIVTIILLLLLFAKFVTWLAINGYEKQKKRDAVDGTDWLTYDSTGDIKVHRKMVRRELYNDMGRRKRT